MKPNVLIGSSIPVGVEQLRVHKKLKQGDFVLTLIPQDKNEALAVARYCQENRIYLCFSEFLFRGAYELCFAYRKHIPRSQFHSKADIDEIIDAAGEYYFGRYAIGEIGGVVYWPKFYTINRMAENWKNLPAVDTMVEAQNAYMAYCKQWLDYERKELGRGPLINVDSSLLQKHQAMAGLDILCLEVMPGDPHLMHAAIRGTARAFRKPFGVHIAMKHYGGLCFDELYQKRWRTSVFFSYINGADFILPECGHYTYANARGQKYSFPSKEMKRIRSVIREAWQFSRIHTRPALGPKAAIGVVHGNLDGAPGLWNRYVWGQYYDEKWLEGPAERGWHFVDKFYRKEDWPKETVQGEQDFSGNPPYGQYDIVPVEASLVVLQNYPCLIFLGWNTMTPEIYKKLKVYVKAGGHLVMYLPHLSTHVDRAKALTLFRNGDFSDLFGIKIKGRFKKDVHGIKCLADSSLKSYRFPLQGIGSDVRFIGNMTPARVEMTTGKVISSWWDDFAKVTPKEFTRRPILVENSLGRGKSFLVTAWEYPADEGISRFTEDLLRVVLQGEQGDIRLLTSDRVRYAVYAGELPRSRKKYSVIYMLNTDPDCSQFARLWCRGRTTEEFIISANDLRLAYYCDGVVLLPEDKRVDIKAWKIDNDRHVIELFNARNQKIKIYNLGKAKLTVLLNGSRYACKTGKCKSLSLKKRVDPRRNEFFAANFQKEPAVKYIKSMLPYGGGGI